MLTNSSHLNRDSGPFTHHGRYLGAASFKTIAGIVGAVVAVVLLGSLLFRTSAEDLLNADTLTPEQIRKVATKYLVHESFEIREKASAKLADMPEESAPVLSDICRSYEDMRVRTVVLALLMAIDDGATIDVIEEGYRDGPSEWKRECVRNATRFKNQTKQKSIMERAKKMVADAAFSDDIGVLLEGVGGVEVYQIKSKKIEKRLYSLVKKHEEMSVRRHAARAFRAITGKEMKVEMTPALKAMLQGRRGDKKEAE